MNKNLKKVLGLSVIMIGATVFNVTNIFAYHNDDEQQEYTDSIPKKYEQRLRSVQRANIQNQEFTVVIDAGHGGKDSGSVNKELKVYEKNLNLDIAKAVEKRLSDLGINVVMTRTNDTFLELYERSQIANSMGADLFVSIHNDTSEGNGDGAHIIHSVYDKNGGMSKTLATNIGNSIKSNTSQNLKKYNPIWSRYNSKKDDDYYAVIRQTEMPSVIVEHAYMNNNDIQAVDTPQKRIIMGQAVADGIYKTIKDNFSGWMKYKTKWVYYQGAEKIKATGWKVIDGTWYYFNETGLMQTGWQKIDNVWYYLESNGAMQKGWKKINNLWYYFDGSGAMQIGWKKIDNVWYYLNESGSMATGWKKVNDKWYYLNEDGSMHVGWKKLNNVWYYLNEDGSMHIGWKKLNNVWYYLNEDGSMHIGWKKLNNVWYYLNEDGSMQTGWLNIGNDTYYLKESGEMVTGDINIDSIDYYFDIDGKLMYNF